MHIAFTILQMVCVLAVITGDQVAV